MFVEVTSMLENAVMCISLDDQTRDGFGAGTKIIDTENPQKRALVAKILSTVP